MKTPEKQSNAQPRTKPAEVRLDELMDAAQRLFISQGFDATTVSDIVRDAGVAKGTFYHYFTSKNEMLGALRQRYTARFICDIQRAIDACPAEDGTGRLQAWCHAGVTAYLEGMALHDALYHDHHYHTRGNHDRDAVIGQILTLLEEGERSGDWRLENARLTAIIMYHGMHGAVDNLLPDPARDNRLGAQLTAEFMSLLGCR